jgi:hypothetical protein
LQGKRHSTAFLSPPSKRPQHGKEGVDGSSPSEGSAKVPHAGAFSLSRSDRLAPRRTCAGLASREGRGRICVEPGAGRRCSSSVAVPSSALALRARARSPARKPTETPDASAVAVP